MSPTPICGLAIALGCYARVASGDPLAIRTTGPLPFTSAELEAALSLRAGLATSEASAQIVASVTGDHARVRIAVVGRQRDVALDGQGGVDAARLVAFAILDLAGDQLDPPSATREEPQVAAPERTATAEENVYVIQPYIVPDRTHPPRWSFGLWGLTGSQVGGTLDGALELGVPVAGAIHGTLSAGVDGRETLGTSATVRAFPIRAGLAWRARRLPIGELEVRASALGVVLEASASRADTSVIYGAGGALVWSVPLVRGSGIRMTILAGAGLDGFVTAHDYRVNGTPIATTDRLAAWAGLGVAAELWR